MKYIHNASGGTKTYQSIPIDDGVFFLIPEAREFEYSTDDDLLADIANGDVFMSRDGETDISGVSFQIDFLKDNPAVVDSDNVPLTRDKITKSGWTFNQRAVTFKTSLLNSAESNNIDGDPFGGLVLKFFNAAGTELTTQEDLDNYCVRTEIFWEQPYDYDLIGGTAEAYEVPEGYASTAKIWVQGLPRLPGAYGGEVNLIDGRVLKKDKVVRADGRRSKTLPYSATYHTNEMRASVRHLAGNKIAVEVVFEKFYGR